MKVCPKIHTKKKMRDLCSLFLLLKMHERRFEKIFGSSRILSTFWRAYLKATDSSVFSLNFSLDLSLVLSWDSFLLPWLCLEAVFALEDLSFRWFPPWRWLPDWERFCGPRRPATPSRARLPICFYRSKWPNEIFRIALIRHRLFWMNFVSMDNLEGSY